VTKLYANDEITRFDGIQIMIFKYFLIPDGRTDPYKNFLVQKKSLNQYHDIDNTFKVSKYISHYFDFGKYATGSQNHALQTTVADCPRKHLC
jgi:hypothetical protein